MSGPAGTETFPANIRGYVTLLMRIEQPCSDFIPKMRQNVSHKVIRFMWIRQVCERFILKNETFRAEHTVHTTACWFSLLRLISKNDLGKNFAFAVVVTNKLRITWLSIYLNNWNFGCPVKKVSLLISDAICNNPYSTCQKISSCPPALEDIIHGGHPKICNFEGNEPIVCCDMRRSTGLQHGNVDVITIVSDSSENTLGRLKHNPQNPTGPPFGWLQHNAQNPSMPPFSRFPNNAQRPPLESQFGRFQNNVRNPMGPPFGRPQNPSGNPFQRLISNNQNEPQIPIPRLENNVQKPSGDTSERSDGATETTPFTEEPPTTQPNAGNTQSIDAGTTTTESSVWTTTPPPPIPGIENTKCVQSKCT